MFFPFISLRPLVGEAGGYSDEQFRRPSVRLSVRPFVRPSVRVCVCSVCTTLLNLAAGDLFILFFRKLTYSVHRLQVRPFNGL